MFKEVLKSIYDDLSRIEKINKDTLFESKVQDTLNTSYDAYCQNLKLNYDYLLYRDTLKVLKTIKREKNKREKSL